jgi:hypothetical protein
MNEYRDGNPIKDVRDNALESQTKLPLRLIVQTMLVCPTITRA